MNLILIAACLAVCQGAKLNRGYLPPESAKTAGGNGDILQTPFRSSDKSLPTGLPAGSYVNDFEGVVIDADAAGTRATHSGLGNSRVTYGSTDSKVGEAAFRETNLNANIQEAVGKPVKQVQDETARPGHIGHVNHHDVPNVAGVRQPLSQPTVGVRQPVSQPVAGVRQPVLQPGEHNIPVLEAERFHAVRDRTSNIIAFQNDIGITDFNYAFHTDNGISAAEVGVALDGVKSKGGYSYTGDDGQVYTISYTADEDGYRPQGSHIPTPPPIPEAILKALKQNAKDEAAGIVDDGSYDAKKYNTGRTKGNRPNDYNDKDKHITFERPVFNVISNINQNSQANKPNRDEDNRNNGQNQFPDVNLGYTVNDKLISNFSNIRNQYENEFDILTNNKFNNNGPISNFKDLSEVTLSNDNKNQSQNVPLSQQKLQDRNEVQDFLTGRPNSYEAPIAAIQNQQQNNAAAVLKQTQAQLSLYQSSINKANENQQTVARPENSFGIINNFQSKPTSYQTQIAASIQGQQNFNKKGTFFQTQFQSNLNTNKQNQQYFSSSITPTQFNTNEQQVYTNTSHKDLPSEPFNVFSKPILTQTRPTYPSTTTENTLNQKPIANMPNVLSDPTQSRPASYYDSSITGLIQNQQPMPNLNNVFSNSITTPKKPNSFDASTIGTTQKQSTTRFGVGFFNSVTAQAKPNSYDAPISGTIEKQTEQSGNIGNAIPNLNPAQLRPISYFSQTSGATQKLGNLDYNFFNPTPNQGKPNSYDAAISETTKKQEIFSDLIDNNFTKPTPTLTTSLQSTITVNSSSHQSTSQANPGSQSQQSSSGFSNALGNGGQSVDVQYARELYEYPKPNTNLEKVESVASVMQQTRPNSYNTAFPGTVHRQQSIFNSANANQFTDTGNANKQNPTQFMNTNSQKATTNNNDAFAGNTESPSNVKQGYESTQLGLNLFNVFHEASQHQIQPNNLDTFQQNQQIVSSGVNSFQSLNSNSVQVNKDGNGGNSNFASQPIKSQFNVFDNQVKSEDKPNSQERDKPHQYFFSIPTINQFQNRESANEKNQQHSIYTQFLNINSQTTSEDAHNSDSLSQFSSHNILASPNSASSYEPLQNFVSRPTASSFILNDENIDNNNKGLVAISSSQNHNDDFQSNFLHKKFALRRQQQINQQAFTNFLNSKNIANAPVLISSAHNNPDMQLNQSNHPTLSRNGLTQLISSQLNQPNPTPQTFGVTVSSDSFSTVIPSRTLSTPKEDTIEVSQVTSGITQASISPFPSLAPSTSKESSFNSVFQTGNLPSLAIGSSLGVDSVKSQSQQAVLNLGFGNIGQTVNSLNKAEVYEYPKPDQNIPAPSKEDPNENFKAPSANDDRPKEVKNPEPNILSAFNLENSKTESGNGPKLLPSRPNFISNGCCFTQNNDNNQSNVSNDSSSANSDSKTSTFHNTKEEFEGPKTQQTYDETGYHY